MIKIDIKQFLQNQFYSSRGGGGLLDINELHLLSSLV